MDGTKFDALTKRLAAGTSRRRVLTGLGSALAGTLALRGGVTAAAGSSPCGETFELCSAQARNTFYAAAKACQAGPREAQEACEVAAVQIFNAAIDVCRDQYNDCRFPPPPVCKDNGSKCTVDRECCSDFCLVFVCAF